MQPVVDVTRSRGGSFQVPGAPNFSGHDGKYVLALVLVKLAPRDHSGADCDGSASWNDLLGVLAAAPVVVNSARLSIT